MHNDDYSQLQKIGKEIHNIEAALRVLQWDQETHMACNSAASRAAQLETLASVYHRMRTSKRFSNQLAKLIDIKSGKILANVDDEKKSALKLWRRDYVHAKKLPTSFVKANEKLCSEATLVWADARKENSFIKFAPYLEKIFEFSRKKADYLGYNEHPYDALLDEYEPNCKKSDIEILFKKLRLEVQTLLKRIGQAPQVNDSFLKQAFPKEPIMDLSYELLDDMGYDRTMGRLDFSSHPFSTSFHPTDSRITTRWHETFFKSNIGAILHEGGHALYEMGLPIQHYGTPLCEAVSMGIHESQSRFWEILIGESLPFWKMFYPRLKKAASSQLDGVDLDAFYKGYNRVAPTLIRVDADEVTYSMHIILRFEMESALIDGSLKIRDVPEAWNAKMQEYLGITPTTFAEGCLQDVHWSCGLIGYFPTYTLGNLYAAQFFEVFQKDNPDWKERIVSGDLKFIKHWLNQNIHCHGRRFSSKELVEKVTKNPPNYTPYIQYLTKKYEDIY
ncbi:MAG: carboxypeptidase M32 [Parachlamydiales bacterium]|nr:carboxypeptidase M32 [Parachlamydiales bacterium]